MAIYQCSICGPIFGEEKEGRTLSELTECPVCKQPISKFERIDSDEKPETAAELKGALAYDPQYERQDINSRYMKEIHEMAVSGKSLDSSMGTRMPAVSDLRFGKLPNGDRYTEARASRPVGCG